MQNVTNDDVIEAQRLEARANLRSAEDLLYVAEQRVRDARRTLAAARDEARAQGCHPRTPPVHLERFRAPERHKAGTTPRLELKTDDSLPRLRIQWIDADGLEHDIVFGNYRRYAWGIGNGWDMSGHSGDCYANGSHLGIGLPDWLREDVAVAMHFAQDLATLQVPRSITGSDAFQRAMQFLLHDALTHLSRHATTACKANASGFFEEPTLELKGFEKVQGLRVR